MSEPQGLVRCQLQMCRLCANIHPAVTGFPPGVATAIEIGTDVATAANADYVTAYAQGQALTPTVDEAGLATLTGLTLVSVPALGDLSRC